MSIHKKLIIILLIFIIIPTSLVGMLSFFNSQKAMMSMVITHLKNIADLKVDRIESFIAERRNDITIAQGYPNIKKNLPIVTALANDRMNPAYREAKRALDKQLRLFQGIHDFNNIALLSPHGIVVYTSNESYATEQLNKPLPAPEGKKAFEEGQKVLYFSDIFRY